MKVIKSLRETFGGCRVSFEDFFIKSNMCTNRSKKWDVLFFIECYDEITGNGHMARKASD